MVRKRVRVRSLAVEFLLGQIGESGIFVGGAIVFALLAFIGNEGHCKWSKKKSETVGGKISGKKDSYRIVTSDRLARDAAVVLYSTYRADSIGC